MSDPRTCPACGSELPPDAPGGACPRCLLRAGLGPGGDGATSAAADAPLANPATLSYADGHREPKGAPEAGTRIRYFGDYELLDEIARGGMGVVYRARQVRLNRVVALKMILAGQFASTIDVQRFQTEAEAAAQLDHPGIVPIFEVGEHEGHHFFSMGLVEGESLAARLADGPLPPRAAAELVRKVAEAVQYAHDRGVVHRDLKPANILLAGRVRSSAGRPGEIDCEPRVTDFGLAKKAQSDSNLTATGQILGTPSFMSPEQAAGRTDQVNVPTDVYALGAILYATLTGRPPFQANSPLDTLMQVIEREPVAPRDLNPGISRDLETICLKTLEKDRRRRYATARELVDELQRYLDGRPILARRVSITSRTWRWCRRNPVATAALASVTALFLTTAVGAVWINSERTEAIRQRTNAEEQRREVDRQRGLVTGQRDEAERQQTIARAESAEAERQRNLALDEKRRAQQTLAAGQFVLGRIARENGDTAAALSWYLQAYLNSPEGDPARRSARNLIGAWGGGLKRTLVQGYTVHRLAVSPDGRTAIAGYLDSASQMWNLSTGLPIGGPQRHSGDIVSAEISPDGRFALIGDWAGATVWDTATGRQRYPKLTHFVREDTTLGPALSADGRTIATRSTLDSIRLWDAETGKPRGAALPHGAEVSRIRLSPDGRRVASLGGWVARVWDVESGNPLGKVPGDVADLAFSPDGRVVAACRKDGKVVIQAAASGKLIAELAHDGPLHSVTFDPKGEHLLATGARKAYLWLNAQSDARSLRPLPHDTGLFAAAFSPTGGTVLTAGAAEVRVWPLTGTQPRWVHRMGVERGTRGGYAKSAAFGPDGRSVLVQTQSETAVVLAADTGQVLLTEQNAMGAAIPGDGKSLVVGGADGWVRVRAVEVAESRRFPDAPVPRELGQLTAITFSPDGRLVAVTGYRGMRLFRADTWEPFGEPLPHPGEVITAEFSADSRTLVTTASGKSERLGNPPGWVLFWDVATTRPLGEPIEFAQRPYPVGFDVTGDTVLAGTWLCDVKTREKKPLEPLTAVKGQRSVGHLLWGLNSPYPRLRDGQTGAPARVTLPAANLASAVITQDGRRLLTSQRDGLARLWDAGTGEALGPLFQPVGGPYSQSPDGRYVLYTSSSTRMQIWNPATGRQCGETLPDESKGSFEGRFSPDGAVLATRWNSTAHLWDSASGQLLGPPIKLASTGGVGPVFGPDGRSIVVDANPRGVTRWRVPRAAADDPVRLRLSVEVRTGLEVDENGGLRKLSRAQWLDRKNRLDQLGGPCDVNE